jgi:long-chain acyl-CoA synthetase
VVLNPEVLQETLKTWAVRRGRSLMSWSEDTGKLIEEYLADLRQHINDQLSRFSRLSFLEIQSEPFEKTATLKIKRYLYA